MDAASSHPDVETTANANVDAYIVRVLDDSVVLAIAGDGADGGRELAIVVMHEAASAIIAGRPVDDAIANAIDVARARADEAIGAVAVVRVRAGVAHATAIGGAAAYVLRRGQLAAITGQTAIEERDAIVVAAAPMATAPAEALPPGVVRARLVSAAWLNRTVWGMAATSFLSDLGHEAQSTLLPSFMAGLGLPPAALGAVEGIADATSSFIKLGAGWFSDRVGRRKPFVVAGYVATGLASGIIALAWALPLVLVGKIFGWVGRGMRGPLRDAMLTEAIPLSARGRAFGFHRMADTLGAVIGPMVAVALLASLGKTGALHSIRVLMAWTLVPGVAAGIVFALFVAERRRPRGAPRRFDRALREMPQPFRRYLTAVGIFGVGDFAHTLLILAAGQCLAPRMGPLEATAVAGGLYVFHNVVYAAAAYPAGALADRLGDRRVLAWGYAAAVLVPIGTLICLDGHIVSIPLLAAVFGLAGAVNGVQDTLESSAATVLVPAEHRGLGFGLLGAVNGVGDLASSLVVGALWTVAPGFGFGYAAVCMALGAALMFRVPAASARS